MAASNDFVHQPHSIRLKDYDYPQSGVYFVTNCAYQREAIFGAVIEATCD
ncbi:MAG TPA: hypothetical protein VHL11_17730 [Phototrophicaceae bacterium]|jgi:hypothetical protein|nr:hypothetical protein [Phototrophicaceae bacterium]